jgi:hypothetical protein
MFALDDRPRPIGDRESLQVGRGRSPLELVDPPLALDLADEEVEPTTAGRSLASIATSAQWSGELLT